MSRIRCAYSAPIYPRAYWLITVSAPRSMRRYGWRCDRKRSTFRARPRPLIEDEPDYVRVQCADLPTSVLDDHGISAPLDAPLWVAVRPEKINLSRQAPTAADNWARGVI